MPPVQYEKEVKYWTGRKADEFAKYLYGLGDNFMVAASKQIADLQAELKAQYEPVTEQLYKKRG